MPGLLLPPPLPSGPQPSTAQIGTNNQRIGARLAARGMVFGGTTAGSNARLLRWRDPYAVATVDEFLSTENFFADIAGLAFDAVTNKIYAAGINVNVGTGGNEISITQTDVDTFATDVEIVAQVRLGNLDSAPVSTTQGGLVSDGSFLYFLLCNTNQNSWIGKFPIAGGGLTASLQIPNPATGNSNAGTVLTYDGSNLYASGGGANMWVAKVPTSLVGPTVLNIGVAGSPPPMAFVDANGFWVGDGNSSAYKVALNALSSVTIPSARQGSVAGVCQAVDPAYFWLMQGDASVPTYMALYDKATLTLQRVVNAPSVRAQFAAYMVPLDRAIFWLSQGGSGSSKPFATITPTWTDLSNVPHPPAGRGAGW